MYHPVMAISLRTQSAIGKFINGKQRSFSVEHVSMIFAGTQEKNESPNTAESAKRRLGVFAKPHGLGTPKVANLNSNLIQKQLGVSLKNICSHHS